jgi:Bacteriophage related domain of unknown function
MADDTTLKAAREAILSRWITQWVDGSSPRTPYSFENEKTAPPDAVAAAAFGTDTGSWVRLTMRSVNSEQETLGPVGSRKFTRYGNIHIQVFVPVDRGTADSDTLVGLARTVFEGARFNGVCCYAGSPKEVGPDGRWYQVNVTIPFTYYETL